MTELYRFRTTEQLLDKFHELEEQTIYFASPEVSRAERKCTGASSSITTENCTGKGT